MTGARKGGIPGLSIVLIVFLVILPHPDGMTFGFFAHRKLGRMAVFTLPPEMVGFFKKHVEYLSERSIDPDRRAHAVPGEAPRHYVDIDHFGQNPFSFVPKRWHEAVEMFSEDTLMVHGVLPWHIHVMMERLTRAFADRDVGRILYQATHLGHYIADACTPLHTTKYYNGRTPEQRGIHALWESRVPELHADGFNYLVGRAEYIQSPLERVWELVEISHLKVDTIYQVYDSLMHVFRADQAFIHEMRGQSTVKTYSREFARAFEEGMNQMVQRQMRLAVKSIGDFWFTAWVNAGQPDLYQLEKRAISNRHRKMLRQEQEQWEQVSKPIGRPYPGQE